MRTNITDKRRHTVIYNHVKISMRFLVLVISLLAAAAAEAPYHLPRPAFHAPSFNYGHPAPPPQLPPPTPPAPFPQLPHPHVQQAFHAPPAPQPNFIQSGYHYAQPIPYPQIQYQQPQIQQPSPPQISYNAPSLPVSYPRPQQIYHQPIPSYIQPQAQPSFAYAPQFPVEPIRPLPAFVAPQQFSPIAQQFNSGQGYAYQQPQSSPPFVSQLPLQTQTFSNFPSSSLSSYQADSNQYNTAAQSQTHSEVLDSTVVNRVQNIIKDNEHTSAKEAGLLSLVSGVSLENARPSVEITSFVQNSAAPDRVIDTSSYSSSPSSSAGASSSSGSLPSFSSTNIQPQQNTGAISLSFLPHTQPATSYGPPN
ncbi:hypothetical protein RR46_10765 [Papilio xuthus]|uniref:Uncharacterized protein n=1 Tax=Papilio xuthus TaxID=66420 RepID=A0A194PQU7_PAPXU|nr:hypothetical protein RR46_10765 [Papilio xuthus]